MRCALCVDDSKYYYEQEIKAWGGMQSFKEDPAYKESDIKKKSDKDFLFGYKMALDDMMTCLDSLLVDGDLTKNQNDTLVRYMNGDLCMQLFSILDNQEEDDSD